MNKLGMLNLIYSVKTWYSKLLWKSKNIWDTVNSWLMPWTSDNDGKLFGYPIYTTGNQRC